MDQLSRSWIGKAPREAVLKGLVQALDPFLAEER